MLVKVIMLFLVVMAVLALFGRLRFPRLGRNSSLTCPDCGRPRIGKGPCPCKRG